MNAYLGSTLAVALQIIIQKFFADTTGIKLGHAADMMNREAYGGLMGDYSFATLYIATGFMLLILLYLEFKIINFLKFVLISIVLLYGMISVTSRTGFVALGAVLLFYFSVERDKFKVRQMVLLLLSLSIAIPYLFDMMIANRGEGITSTSGRYENYVAVFNFFADNIFMGVGLGLKNLYQQTGEIVPHNFFIQYLTQVGIIGTTIILSPFLYYYKLNIRYSNGLKYLFFIISIGAMFIPDIVSSRFLYGVLILISASTKRCGKWRNCNKKYEKS